MIKSYITLLILRLCIDGFSQKVDKIIQSSVFANPYYIGACDPEIVWNPVKRER